MKHTITSQTLENYSHIFYFFSDGNLKSVLLCCESTYNNSDIYRGSHTLQGDQALILN